jgi:hypothetical protein
MSETGPLPIERLFDYMDALRDWAEKASSPAYAETCCCGSSVEVGREATPAERRRIAVNFHGRHQTCPQRFRDAESGGES